MESTIYTHLLDITRSLYSMCYSLLSRLLAVDRLPFPLLRRQQLDITVVEHPCPFQHLTPPRLLQDIFQRLLLLAKDLSAHHEPFPVS